MEPSLAMTDLLHTSADAHATYDPAFFAMLFAIEDQHFWFRARNRVLATLLQQVTAPLPPTYRMLEVGCGTGNTVRVAEQVCTPSRVTGMDLFREGLYFARQRVTCGLVQGDMHRPPFRQPFDIIGLFDVLEHLPDDRAVLHDLWHMLTTTGTLLLTVPAFPSLWSYFDEVSCHYRRYTAHDLQMKLVDAGYDVTYLTHYMATIVPLVWGGRQLASVLPQRTGDPVRAARARAQHDLRIYPGVNTLLAYALEQEAKLIAQRRVLPIGTSLLAVATKRYNEHPPRAVQCAP